MKTQDVVCIGALRTPMGRFGGSFREMPVYDLASQVIGKLLLSLKLPPDELDEVIIGHCRQAGNGPNPARTAAVKGGVPLRVPVSTINMACPSGMKALEMASFRLMLGGARFILVGGMESMSTMPYLLKDCRWNGFKMGNRTLYDGWADSTDPLINQGMGETAESLARKYGISRAAQDEYAAASHEKAHKAWEAGYFNGEVIPVEGMEGLVEKDETIRYPADIEKLAKLKPVFDKAGTVTAANACAMGDGAAFMVLSRKDVVASAGLPVLGELVGISQCAVDPAFMGEGPSAAIPLCLEETGMTLGDVDLLEVNEAFAVQVLANEKALQWDREKLNVNGGAIALAHPTGCSGVRIVITLLHALASRGKELGVASLCGAGGVSMATLVRRSS